jgi:hypothetical protein
MFVAPRWHRHGFSNPSGEVARVLGLRAPAEPALASCATPAPRSPLIPRQTQTGCARSTPWSAPPRQPPPALTWSIPGFMHTWFCVTQLRQVALL